MVRRVEHYVNIAEAKAPLSELVEKAARGEEILIARDHKPLAKLGPVRGARAACAGISKGTGLDCAGFGDIPADLRDHTE